MRERARRGREFCLQGTVRDEDQVSANIRGGALGAMMFVPVAPVTVAAKGNGLGVEHRTNALQDADDVYHQRSMAPGTHVAKGNNLGLVLQPCCYLHRPSTALRKPCLFPPETAADPNTRERERERELLFKRETEHLWLRQLIHGRDDNTSVDYRRRRRASACSVVEQGPLRSTKALSDVAPSSPHPPAREECETQEKLNP